MDGLMFNTEEVYSAVGTEVLRRRGHEFTLPLKKEMMGRPPKASFDVMIDWCSLDDTWEQLRDESEVLYIEMLDDYLAPMPGLWELLDALESAGVPKGIATSSQPKLVDVTLLRFGLQLSGTVRSQQQMILIGVAVVATAVLNEWWARRRQSVH